MRGKLCERQWPYVRLPCRILEPCTGCKGQSIFQEPLVIWLQGGPGASGTGYGNFMVRIPRSCFPALPILRTLLADDTLSPSSEAINSQVADYSP